MRRRRAAFLAAAAAALLGAAPALAEQPVDCVGPAGDPQPGTQEWRQRDWFNNWCAGEREFDQSQNPAMNALFAAQAPAAYAAVTADQAMHPDHPRLSVGQLLPGGTVADPFRTLDRWTGAGRGRAEAVNFAAADGATLTGYVFRPPASMPGPYPGVVITTGSIQGYQEAYFWAAEGLAEAGYEVLTFDVQGQGRSDTFPAPGQCTGPDHCPGVPFQQAYNFIQGTKDALNLLLSDANPGRAQLDADRIGLAGHSLGASAASEVGQCDPRVDAIVAWDNLATVDGCPLDTPAMGQSADYFLSPESHESAPDPEAKLDGFEQLRAAGTDTMEVSLRSSTHLEWTYLPYLLPASRLGERVSFHYTLAWFDRYLKGSTIAFSRLTETGRFDASADRSSIGTGTYDPVAAAADPADPAAGNVPYELAGLPVADRLSFYYPSQWSLTAPDGSHSACTNLRAGCPS